VNTEVAEKTMKKILILMLASWLPAAFADFILPGSGELQLADGQSQVLDFGFSYKQYNGGFVFQAGNQQVEVADVPEKYTLALVLHQDKEVWITDWANKPLTAFNWTLKDHKLVLQKNTDPKFNDKARGGFVLFIDDTPYFFYKNMAQLKFHFDKTGLKEMSVEGMFTPGR